MTGMQALPNFASQRVLVAALNWGLGHAARSAVLVERLLQADASVLLGGDGQALTLLRRTFPHLPFVQIPDITLTYPIRNRLPIYLMGQLPTMLRQVSQEHHWLQTNLADLNLDAIVSDNRYGLHHKDIPSYLVTHQLRPPVPIVGNQVARLLHRHMHKFTEVWIPDEPGNESLAGRMAIPIAPISVRYIGWLSRWKPFLRSSNRVLLLCGGPENQRTTFEQQLIVWARANRQPAVLVRGTSQPLAQLAPDWVEVYDLLPADEIFERAADCSSAIARSGYSSLMDLMAAGLPALVVPTPGQWEQAYLAKRVEVRFPDKFRSCQRLSEGWKQPVESIWQPLQAKSN